MPHVIVKLWPGKSEQEKTRLAEEITKDVMKVLHYGEESVSVAIEEIKPQDWAEKVYTPEILVPVERANRGFDSLTVHCADYKGIIKTSATW
jgi:4-oxalocrotonate tautomerase